MRKAVKESTDTRRPAALPAALLAVLVGASCTSSAMLERNRQQPDPFARISDQTPVHAWEYGNCETAADCVPQGCHEAVCSPVGTEGTCIQGSILGACLSQVPDALCGCEAGVCRWARSPEVLQCAVAAYGRPNNTAVIGTQPGFYPARQRDGGR